MPAWSKNEMSMHILMGYPIGKRDADSFPPDRVNSHLLENLISLVPVPPGDSKSSFCNKGSCTPPFVDKMAA